jgi:hypothetical protein
MGKALDIYRAVSAIFLALVVLSLYAVQEIQQSALQVIAVIVSQGVLASA